MRGMPYLTIESFGGIPMLDLYMVLTLAVTYALFSGFLSWCGRVIQEPESERK